MTRLTFVFLVFSSMGASQYCGSHVLLGGWGFLGETVSGAAIVLIVDLEVYAAKGTTGEFSQFLSKAGLAATFIQVQPSKKVTIRAADKLIYLVLDQPLIGMLLKTNLRTTSSSRRSR